MATITTAQQRRLELNRRIETILRTSAGSALSAEDTVLLRQYTGYGGINHESTIGTPQMTEYYTDHALVRKMWAMVQAYFAGTIRSVLEPACGSGRFFDYLPATVNRAVGYEISEGAVAVARTLYGAREGVDIRLDSFESMFYDNRRSIAAKLQAEARAGRGFDVVIGNPPYGDFQSMYAGLGERKATGARSFDEYFISRGLDVLNPGGVLCYVVGGSVEAGSVLLLDRQYRSTWHKQIYDRAQLLDAYRLPQGIFQDTDVSTEIVVFRRRA